MNSVGPSHSAGSLDKQRPRHPGASNGAEPQAPPTAHSLGGGPSFRENSDRGHVPEYVLPGASMWSHASVPLAPIPPQLQTTGSGVAPSQEGPTRVSAENWGNVQMGSLWSTPSQMRSCENPGARGQIVTGILDVCPQGSRGNQSSERQKDGTGQTGRKEGEKSI